jgi:hypothetical protein
MLNDLLLQKRRQNARESAPTFSSIRVNPDRIAPSSFAYSLSWNSSRCIIACSSTAATLAAWRSEASARPSAKAFLSAARVSFGEPRGRFLGVDRVSRRLQLPRRGT